MKSIANPLPLFKRFLSPARAQSGHVEPVDSKRLLLFECNHQVLEYVLVRYQPRLWVSAHSDRNNKTEKLRVGYNTENKSTVLFSVGGVVGLQAGACRFLVEVVSLG